VKKEWDDNVISIDVDDDDSILDGDKKPAAVAAPAIKTHVQQATHAKERKNKPKKATKKSRQKIIVRVPVNSSESADAFLPEGEG